MGVSGIFFILAIVFIVILLFFPKLSKYYDSIEKHFDIKDDEDKHCKEEKSPEIEMKEEKENVINDKR